VDGSLLGADEFYDAGDGGCAGPALRDIARILEDLPPGRALEIRTTEPSGRDNLRAYCRMRGFPIEAEDAGPDADRILVRKA
jgi:TusA-related sulfurtransferase